jgi:kumamolisin
MALNPAESQATINFVISLQMPNFTELQSKLDRKQRVSANEMESRYLPSTADYIAVRDWLRAEGFTITQEDPNHTNIFAKGTVLQIQKSMETTFARVATDDGEFSSATSVPSLPEEISRNVLSIDGLQPHRRMHVHNIRPSITKFPGNPQTYVLPTDILTYYNAPSGLDGAGQTIAIIIDANVSPVDLAGFYGVGGITKTRTGTFTPVPVNGGAVSSADALEAAMDVEWSSGIAPGANIRLYTIPSLADADIIAAITKIGADSAAYNISVTSMSFGGPEDAVSSPAYIQAFAQNTWRGITNVASSGDYGPYATRFYTTSPDAAYPASDPNVTGIGGTTIHASGTASNYVSETLFSEVPVSGTYSVTTINATGGGVSSIFPRPNWQTDGSSFLATQTKRCVPDVAAFWGTLVNQDQAWQGYACVVLNSIVYNGEGTSLSAPIWAGVASLINQARANSGEGNVGNLGPYIYPLHGTSAFEDIDASGSNVMSGVRQGTSAPWVTYSNSNGAYSVGGGYDLCTGLGRPNITNLVTALGGVLGPGSRFIISPTITITPNYLGGTVTAIKPTGFSRTP